MEALQSLALGEFNFAHHLLELNASRGKKTAYVDDKRALSFQQLDSAVRRFGDGLKSLGMRREERLLIALHDCVEWPIAFLGCMCAGVVPVPVNTLLPADDYRYLVSHSGATAAFVSTNLCGAFAQLIEQLPTSSLKFVITSDRESESFPIPIHHIQSILDSGSEQSDGSLTSPDGIAFWLYSSGSTGRPKAVVHTHANLFWTSALYAKTVMGIREDDRVFSAAKLFFAYGLGNALTFPLSVGATTILMSERPTPEAVIKRLKDLKPTIFCGAPTLYASLLAYSSLPARGETALRLCTSAGEALPREIGEQFAAHFGCDILDGLGSTEMLHIFVSNRPGNVRYGTTGQPVDGYELELRDEGGKTVGVGEIGDLWVKGPSVALMYWNDRARSRETFHGHWMRTGDKYTCTSDGYYIYAGRNDDMLKISGQYVSPFEVESTLMEHPLVLESAVIGVQDPVGISKCKAFVVLRSSPAQSNSELADELKAFVKSRLAPFKRPHFVEFVAELPKTSTGKIQRFKLRELSGPLADALHFELPT